MLVGDARMLLDGLGRYIADWGVDRATDDVETTWMGDTSYSMHTDCILIAY